MIRALLVLCCLAAPVGAETIVAARTIPAQTVLTFEDLAVKEIEAAGGIVDPFSLVGKESRVALYAGRPIRAADVMAPAIVERNQLIALIFQTGSLSIRTEGRALDRGGAGDLITVLNLGSRTTVTAQLGADGAAYVGARH